MSAENIPAFHAKVAASAELQSRLAAIQSQAARSTAEAVARLATEIGTPFTAEELLTTTSEISDHDLADLAGGATVVKKEKADNCLRNLWGLTGNLYDYTTDDGDTHRSGKNFAIGDTFVESHRIRPK